MVSLYINKVYTNLMGKKQMLPGVRDGKRFNLYNKRINRKRIG